MCIDAGKVECACKLKKVNLVLTGKNNLKFSNFEGEGNYFVTQQRLPGRLSRN
jgi:hypothetical protein